MTYRLFLRVAGFGGGDYELIVNDAESTPLAGQQLLILGQAVEVANVFHPIGMGRTDGRLPIVAANLFARMDDDDWPTILRRLGAKPIPEKHDLFRGVR